MIGIYKITNLINNKVYIGQSVNIERRWRNEKTRAFNKNSEEYMTLKSQAFRKYGLENFIFEVVEECNQDELDAKEKYWIQFYNSYHDGYNATTGGQQTITKSKITQDKLDNIIFLLQENQLTEQEIANLEQVSIGTISEINQGHTWHQNELSYPLRSRSNYKHPTLCLYCGKIIDTHSTMCVQCYKDKTFNFNTPSAEKLTELLYVYKGNLSAIGRLYGVSKNPINRLIQEYNLQKVLLKIKTKVTNKPRIIDDQGNIFNSTAEANKYYNISHVKEVCDGKRKTCGGHTFKYLEE